MSKLQKHIVDERSGLSYTLHDGYYLPDIAIPDCDRIPLGKYGMMRLDYLREHRPVLYSGLLSDGELWPHLREIDKACRERLDLLIPQLAKAEGVTEQMKMEDQMRWVGHMNSIKNRVEEMLLAEPIYV